MATKKKPAKKASRAPAPKKFAVKNKSAPKKAAVSAKKAAQKKPAAKNSPSKTAKNAVVQKPTAKKTAPPPSAPVKKAAPAAPAKAAAPAPVSKPAPAPKPKPAPSTPPTPTSASNKNLSPEEKKKLATQHMWELVQQKKQRAAQSPSWRTIEHHDHPAPQGGQGSVTDQNSGASIPSEMPGHRDRGSS